jgi:hypothetical protein
MLERNKERHETPFKTEHRDNEITWCQARQEVQRHKQDGWVALYDTYGHIVRRAGIEMRKGGVKAVTGSHLNTAETHIERGDLVPTWVKDVMEVTGATQGSYKRDRRKGLHANKRKQILLRLKVNADTRGQFGAALRLGGVLAARDFFLNR